MSDSTGKSPRDDGLGPTRLTRRSLLKFGAAGVAGVATGGALLAGPAAPAEAAPPALMFLTEWEFDYVTAMAETIWPTDELGPGARVAGVGYYIDGQLAGSWGQGHRFYLNGPFFTPPDTGPRLADPDDAGRGVPRVPAGLRRRTASRRTATRITEPHGGAADAGADRPPDEQAPGSRSPGRPRSRTATSSRCSARTCSRECSPTPRTAATGTWSAGSGSASRATRCAAATATPSTSSRRSQYPFEHKPLPLSRSTRSSASRAAPATTGSRTPANVVREQADERGCEPWPTRRPTSSIVGVGWVGGIIAAELTKAGLNVRRARARSPARRIGNWQDDHDELRYAIRYELFQNTAERDLDAAPQPERDRAADAPARLVPARHRRRRRGRALERPDVALPPARLHDVHEHGRALRQGVRSRPR